MSKFVIEKNIPLPTRGTGISATLRRMEVGDSALADREKRNSIIKIARDLGMRVSVRSSGDTVRFWRIE